MALRRALQNSAHFSKSFIRNYSSSSALIDLQINEKTGIATASLQRLPVNSLNLELLTELSSTLTQLEKNKFRGLILTSNAKTVFCAGLDITEMVKPDIDRYKQFWTTLQQVWIKLYGSSFPTVAVINGHAPAGGCLLAISCEYRIMLNNFTIGLNETQLGMVVKSWFVAAMRNAIGFRETEIALTSGRLFKTDEAHKIGLIDEIADSKEDGIARAEKFLRRFEKIQPHARAFTKQLLRGADIKDLENKLDQELQEMTNTITQEPVQKSIGAYLEALKQKQKQKQ